MDEWSYDPTSPINIRARHQRAKTSKDSLTSAWDTLESNWVGSGFQASVPIDGKTFRKRINFASYKLPLQLIENWLACENDIPAGKVEVGSINISLHSEIHYRSDAEYRKAIKGTRVLNFTDDLTTPTVAKIVGSSRAKQSKPETPGENAELTFSNTNMNIQLVSDGEQFNIDFADIQSIRIEPTGYFQVFRSDSMPIVNLYATDRIELALSFLALRSFVNGNLEKLKLEVQKRLEIQY